MFSRSKLRKNTINNSLMQTTVISTIAKVPSSLTARKRMSDRGGLNASRNTRPHVNRRTTSVKLLPLSREPQPGVELE